MSVKVLVAAVCCSSIAVAFGQDASTVAQHARDAFRVPASVRIARDLVYATYGERQLKLDLYFPAKSASNERTSAVVVVRGGGWQAGDKDAFGFMAGQLARDGFIAASIEYRTADEAKFPAAVHDVKAAVRWLRSHAREHGIDPDAIGAIGASAGGHLVAMLATTADRKELEGEGGSASASSRVQAVVVLAGVFDLRFNTASIATFLGAQADEAGVKAASPLTYVDAGSAPILMLHSRTDPAVPFAQSVDMQQAYAAANVPAVLKPIDAPNTHPFWNDARHFPQTMKLAAGFLGDHLE